MKAVPGQTGPNHCVRNFPPEQSILWFAKKSKITPSRDNLGWKNCQLFLIIQAILCELIYLQLKNFQQKKALKLVFLKVSYIAKETKSYLNWIIWPRKTPNCF